MVNYENQNASDVRNRIQANQITFKGKNFKEIFDKYSADNANILSSAFKTSTADDSTQEFLAVLEKIKNQERWDAFASIDQSNLPEGAPTQQKGPIAPTKSLLKDWYQFVYQRTLATHLGACLTAVSASENSYEQIAGQHMASLIEDQPTETPNQTHPHKSSRLLNKAPAGLKRRFAPSPSQSLMLSGSITDILGGMPYHVFACFLRGPNHHCTVAQLLTGHLRTRRNVSAPRTLPISFSRRAKKSAYSTMVRPCLQECARRRAGSYFSFVRSDLVQRQQCSALADGRCCLVHFHGSRHLGYGTLAEGTHSTFKTIVFMEE